MEYSRAGWTGCVDFLMGKVLCILYAGWIKMTQIVKLAETAKMVGEMAEWLKMNGRRSSAGIKMVILGLASAFSASFECFSFFCLTLDSWMAWLHSGDT